MLEISFAGRGPVKRQAERLDLDALPGPAIPPLLGHHLATAQLFFDPVAYLDKLASGAYGDVVIFARRMRRGLNPTDTSPAAVFLYSPRYMQQVLMKHTTYPRTVMARLSEKTWGETARLTGGGLLWLEGDEHRKHRHAIMPLHHQRHVRGYRDLIASMISKVFDRFRLGETVGMMDEAGRVLVEFQNRAVLGVAGEPGRMGRLGERLAELYELLADPRAHVLPNSIPWTPGHRLSALGDAMVADLANLIEAKRRAGPGASDVLSLLIHGDDQAGPLTAAEILAEIAPLFVAGWVSTRAAVAWTAFLLAQHPQVAADLHDELSSVLHGDAPTIEQLKQLPLLDGVIKESLRLMPPAPLLTRAAAEPVEIGGYRLPAGTELHLSIYHTHRDPELYAQPRRFLPERWSSLKPPSHSYLPFGIGSRTCPGMALATLELKLFFSMLMQRYRLEVPHRSTVQCTGVGVMVPKGDLRLRVQPQDRQFARSRAEVRGNITKMIDF